MVRKKIFGLLLTITELWSQEYYQSLQKTFFLIRGNGRGDDRKVE